MTALLLVLSTLSAAPETNDPREAYSLRFIHFGEVLRAKADGYNKKLRRELGLDDDYVPDATRPPASASRGGVSIGPMLTAGATGVCLSATF